MADKSLIKKKSRKSKVELDENGNPIEEPSIVAQRLINIFKQLHVFNEGLQKDFDNMLLSTDNEVRAMFETFPGGIPVREYLEELEENAGIIHIKEDNDVSDEEKSKAKVLAEALAAAQDKNSEKSHLQAMELAKQQAKFMAEAQAEAQKNLVIARENNDHHAVAQLEHEIKTGEQKLAVAQAEAGVNIQEMPSEALGGYQAMAAPAPAQGDLAKEIVSAVTEVMKLTEEERRKENQELIKSLNRSSGTDLAGLIKQAEDGKIEISQDAIMADTFSDSIREMERNRAMENKELIRSMTETQMKIASLAFEKNNNQEDNDSITKIGEMLIESQKAQAEQFSKVISEALAQTHDNSIKSFSDALTSSQENSINLQAEALSNALANNSGKSADAIAEALAKANQQNDNIVDSINNTDKSPSEVTNALNKALSFGNKIKNAINIKDIEEKSLTENQIDELSKSFKEETPEIQNEIFNEAIEEDEFEVNIDDNNSEENKANEEFENLINDDMSSLFLDDDETIDLDSNIDDIKFDDDEINLDEELGSEVELPEDDDFEYVEEIEEDDEEYEYVEEEVEAGEDEEYEHVEEEIEASDDEEYEYVEEEVEASDDEEYEYVEEEVETVDDTTDDENIFDDEEITSLLSEDDLSIELDDIQSEINEENDEEIQLSEESSDDEEYEWVEEDEDSDEYEWVDEEDTDDEEYEWVEEDEDSEEYEWVDEEATDDEEYEWVEEDEDSEEYEWIDEDEETNDEEVSDDDIDIETEEDADDSETNFSGDYEWVYDEEYEESLTGNTDEEYEWVEEDDNENVWDNLDNSESHETDEANTEEVIETENEETSDDEEYEWVEEDEDGEEYEWVDEDEEDTDDETSPTDEDETQQETDDEKSTEIAVISENEIVETTNEEEKSETENTDEDYLWNEVEEDKEDEFEDIHDDETNIIEENEEENLFPDYLEDSILDEVDPYENYIDQLTYFTENKQDKSTILIDDFLKFEPYFIDSNDDNKDYDPYQNIDNGNVATAIYVNVSDDQKAVKYKKTKNNQITKENLTISAVEKQSEFEDENLSDDPYENGDNNHDSDKDITYKNNDDDPYSV